MVVLSKPSTNTRGAPPASPDGVQSRMSKPIRTLARRRGALVALLGLLLTLSLARRAAAAGTCEQEVVKQCVAVTCPAFCAKAGSKKAACRAGCTAKARCRISLFGGQDRKDQVALETEKRAQLMACLAENRSAIVVSRALGAPRLPTPRRGAKRARKPNPAPSRQKATRGRVSSTLSRRTAWKAIETQSFRRYRIGKALVKHPVASRAPAVRKLRKR